MEKSKKQALILSIVAVVTLIALVIGATYAYFKAQGGASSSTEVKVTTNTTDNATTYSAKVGLMYASDYGFAAAPSAWTTGLSSYDGEAIKNVNWMYMGLYEWTISRNADDAFFVFYVYDTGNLGYDSANGAYGVRPVFYLTSSVNYVSGSGTAADPISIN